MITLANFDQEIISRKATALLVFTAEWCRPCGLQKAVIDKLVEKFASKILIEIIDVDIEPELADRFSARTLPTTILFAEGEIVEALPGYQAEEFLASYLQHIIENVEKAADSNQSR